MQDASAPASAQPLSQLYPELLQQIHNRVSRRTEQCLAQAEGRDSATQSPNMSFTPSTVKVALLAFCPASAPALRCRAVLGPVLVSKDPH